MLKIALLIGVSEYLPGLNSLPAAEKDIREMQRVLEHHDIGGFDNVQSLINPSSHNMRIAIETLFSTCTRDDLVLLYFSGHGITDDNNKFYFASCDTQKNAHGLIRSTAVSAGAVHDFMEDSRSKRKVVILDCCYSGAFAKGMTAKNLMDVVDIQKQLGGEGRAVLTSSTSTQYSFEQKGSDLSVYTHYLIEGLETGAADCDEDGAISAEDLHTYAKQKVQESSVAMKPELYVSREGFKIFLAQAPTTDPSAQFRREVERLAQQGQIPDIHGDIPDVLLTALEAKSRALGLSPQYAEASMTEVLKPYREHKRCLRTYERHFRAAIADENTLSDEQRSNLQYLQKSLKLNNEDIEWIEQRVFNLLSFESIPNYKPAPLQNQSVVAAHSLRPSESDFESKTQPQPVHLRRKFDYALEKIKDHSFLLLLGLAIPVGAVPAYLIIDSQNINLQPITQKESTLPSLENADPQLPPTFLKDNMCVKKEGKEEPLRLFSDPEQRYNGILLQPGTKVQIIEINKSASYWVHVMAEEGEGWTYIDELEDCNN